MGASARCERGTRGFGALQAKAGRAAQRACGLAPASGAKIDLLLTDVVMPQMGGPALAKLLAASWPTMKVLCMSGHTDNSIRRKPITAESLTGKVRDVIDGERTAVCSHSQPTPHRGHSDARPLPQRRPTTAAPHSHTRRLDGSPVHAQLQRHRGSIAGITP